MNFIKKYWEILVIFLFSLTPLLWFRGNEIILGHDSGFRLNYLEHIQNLFFSWNSIHNFGTDWGILKGFLIVQAPETFFSVLFSSLQTGEKLSFILWFFVIGVSMYIFTNSFFPKKEFWILRVFSSLFYMFNFFILQAWFIAERAKFSVFAALPITTLVLYKTFMREYSLVKGTILFSFTTFFLNGGGSPPLLGSLLLVLGVTFMFLSFVNIKKRGIEGATHALKVLVSFVAGSLLINAYFIIPHLYQITSNYRGVLSSIGGIEGILAWENAVNRYASFINLFRLQGIPDWYDNPLHSYSKIFIENPVLIALSFLSILIITLGLYLYSKDSRTKKENTFLILMFLIFLIGLVFAAGSHPPLGPLYIFLVKYLPGFAIFRSAFYKFGPAFWFSAVFLTGYFLNYLINNYIEKKDRKLLLGVFFIGIIIIYHFPFFSVNFFEFSKPFSTKVTVPDYVYQAISQLNKSPDSRVLLLPKLDPIYKVDSYDWGFWSLESLPKLSINSSILSNDNVSPSIVNALYKAIDIKDEVSFLQLADMMGVKKILWRGDVLYNDKKTTSHNLSFEKNNLSKFKSVTLDSKYGKWEIYNIDAVHKRPPLYASDQIVYGKTDIDLLPELINEEEERNERIVVSEKASDKAGDFLEDYANKVYIQPDCILCRAKEYQAYKNRIQMPYVSLLPSSLFYFTKSWSENRIFNKYEKFPAQRIDVNLSISNVRMAEIGAMVFEESLNQDHKERLVGENISKYKILINDVIRQSVNLSEYQRNEYKLRIVSFLSAQRSFMYRLHFRQGFPDESYDNLFSFINDNIRILERDLWVSSPTSKRFFFDIQKSGSYRIETLGDEALPSQFILDGKRLNLNEEVVLKVGTHKLQLDYPEANEAIMETDGEFALNNAERIDFNFNSSGSLNRYVISFDYKIEEGDNSIQEFFVDDEKKARFVFTRDSEWKTVSYEFSSNNADPIKESQAYLINSSRESNKTVFREFSISKVFVPKVLITKEGNDGDYSSPLVQFTKVNPTKYSVKVKGADKPFILVFSQSFDSGWKAYVKNDGRWFNPLLTKSVADERHFKLNGYANGWYIDNTGEYEMLVIFRPQYYFYIGIIISAVTTLLMLLVYVKKIRKN